MGSKRRQAMGDDGYVRATFTQPRNEARQTARAFLDRWPVAAYMSAVECWRKLPGVRSDSRREDRVQPSSAKKLRESRLCEKLGGKSGRTAASAGGATVFMSYTVGEGSNPACAAAGAA